MSPLTRRYSSRNTETAQAHWVREFSDLLDSNEPSLTFDATIRVEWRRQEGEPGSATAYRDVGRAVRRIAESFASQRNVLRWEATEQDINHELRRLVPWCADGIEILRAQVTLRVDDHTRITAQRIAQLQREEALEELARRQTSARIRFMQDEILRTPATARLYLLLEQNAHHGHLPPGTDTDQIVREVQQWHPQAQWVAVAQLLHTFLGKLTDKDAGDLLRTLQALFLEYGEKELAKQLPIEPVKQNSMCSE
ncbi:MULTISPECIES: hypothetical protein [unclassified Streptomyces]|uniref:hypothetical protein n=1 Tax=unclassified Streptomyces TaxID=2593676 RepID=UPI001438B94A|nr:hypothetical protein [Streptomyces sp. NEAU-H3]NJA55084.1 hypothetical protein [Streptomyces sp. NEAU-H3]